MSVWCFLCCNGTHRSVWRLWWGDHLSAAFSWRTGINAGYGVPTAPLKVSVMHTHHIGWRKRETGRRGESSDGKGIEGRHYCDKMFHEMVDWDHIFLNSVKFIIKMFILILCHECFLFIFYIVVKYKIIGFKCIFFFK